MSETSGQQKRQVCARHGALLHPVNLMEDEMVKYFSDQLTAYTYKYAAGMHELHLAFLARATGDDAAYTEHKAKADDLFKDVDAIWGHMSAETQSVFLEHMGEE